MEFSFRKRLTSMLKVDLRRMFTMPLYYIIVGISLVIPVLILVMTSMMAGTETVDPVTGAVTIMEGFTNVWQAIGSASSANAGMSMDLVSMCNINMMFFGLAVLVCLNISEDFRSGYSKNLFTVRSDKKDYVISKTITGFIGGASMLIFYFIGSMLGGAISSLSFELVDVNLVNIFMCMLSKIFLVLVFVSIAIVMSVASKQRAWLSMILSFGASMLLFTMIPMITPLDSNITNVMLCLIGGILFSVGIGAISNTVLKKTSLVRNYLLMDFNSKGEK